MNRWQRWFYNLSSGVERFLWGSLLLLLILTMAGQALLGLEMGRRLLNPVESLEGIPWPPEPGPDPG
ncbi:MAG: hypothetical protein GX973_07005 [Firmicutes bacterium]|nr:hypothetical protein [Bacillota bacterium]